MVMAAHVGDHVQPPGRRIRRRRARDTRYGADVSARQRRGVDRIAEVAGPHRRAREEVERVHGVVLGRHDHMAVDDQGRGEQIGIHTGVPRHASAGERRVGGPDPGPSGVAVILRPLRGDGGGGARNSGRARCDGAGGLRRAPGDAQRDAQRRAADQSPQVNFLPGCSRARSGAISSTRPCMAMPRLGPIASTTIAARGSALRLRSLTPSTSKSREPSSFIVYITGTTCGQPEGPTVAKRAILCERRNSSSASLNTTHILNSSIHMTETLEALGAYTVTRRVPLERLDGSYLELTHNRTGARHIHIDCPDDNNAFAVFFPTPPADSTGVAHILEHVVLAGSQRFPVRDQFFSMTRRSLATFMNALTGSDWTMYLFSTRNAKDFRNLLDVYLDATLDRKSVV